MVATGFTSGDPRKVDVTGDTMTGTLVLEDGSPAASEEYVAGHGGGGNGTVQSVNGVDPDGSGDVTLTAADVGALATTGGTLTGDIVSTDGTVLASRQYVTDHSGGGDGTAATLPLFNVESSQYAGGAKGDGTTDDYAAIRAAWDDMVSAGGGYLFFPRRAVYRIDATGRLEVGTDRQYALFPIPDVPSTTSSPKKVFGVLGVGEATVIRSWAGNDTDTAANVTASVLQVDYDDPFEWSTDHGHPSVFGCKDADIVGGFSNVHFRVEHLVLRQPPDPSMCGINLECVSTCHVVDYYFDVSGFPDEAPEPTHPTGCGLLLPQTGNAIANRVDLVGGWGHYAGLPITEHGDVGSAIIVRCKVGAFIRRAASAHMAHVTTLAMEQCTWGLAGYDPSGEAPNLGVVACPGWQVKIDFWDVEDFDSMAGMYTPDSGAHLYDPNNALKGGAWFGRVDSGADHGADDAAYVVGGSQFSLLKVKTLTTNVTRLTGTAPDNGGIGPALSPPEAPTIGTATAGDSSASVEFTPSETGDAADTFTATSTPDGHTGTDDSSPITVTGLDNGTTYTFTVHGTNDAGDGDDSEPSNQVTPSSGGPVTFAADTFDRADSDTTLGTSSGGQIWTALLGTWGIKTDTAYLVADGAESYNIAYLDTGHSTVTYTVDLTPRSGDIDLGLCALVQDKENLIFWDISGDTLHTPEAITTRLFHRASGTFSGITDPATITLNPGTTYQLKMVVGATSIECHLDETLVFASNGATGLESQTKFGLVVASGNSDQGSVFDNLTVTS